MAIQTIYRGVEGDSSKQFEAGKAFDTAQANDEYLDSVKPTVIENVAALASTPVVAGRTYYLKEYNAGTGYGGGELVGKSGSTTYDNIKTFAGSGGYFERINYGTLSALHAGCVLSGDTTTRMQAYLDAYTENYFPTGTYTYSSLTGIGVAGRKISGDGSYKTIFKCTASGLAFGINDAGASFVQGVNLSGFTVEGNSATTDILRATAIARSQWEDINVREADNTAGRGIVLRGCMLNRFNSLMCSTDRQAMTNVPNEGLNIEAFAPFGNSTNNAFINCYWEGKGNVANTLEIGARISGGDGNVFISGSPESCGTWGLLLGAQARFNTFIGLALENLAAAGGDCADGGVSNRFVNCYASEKMVLQGQAGVIEGGFFERIQIDSGAAGSKISDVIVNQWATASGGFFDAGNNTQWSKIYDSDLAAYIYPIKDRVGESLPSSGSPYTNNKGQFIKIIVEGGVITGASVTRGANSWNEPFLSASGAFILAPGDQLTLTYSSSPTKFWWIPINGMQS